MNYTNILQEVSSIMVSRPNGIADQEEYPNSVDVLQGEADRSAIVAVGEAAPARPLTNRERFARAIENRKAAPKPELQPKTEPEKPKPKKRGPRKRTLPPRPAEAELKYEIAERGHLYDKPARMVIECRSLPGMSRAIYWLFESRCAANSAKVIMGLEEIADIFSIDPEKASEYIGALRAHSVVNRRERGRQKNGHRNYHEYELPLRQKRLDNEAEAKAKREREKLTLKIRGGDEL